jgi:hypothetical protein
MAPSSPTPFLLGVNYPWLDYAEDFGRTPRGRFGVGSLEKFERVKYDFEQMRECGVRVVRWFLFGDGRGGFLAKDGIPQKPDDFLLNDMDAALRLAQAREIQLCFSLIDFLWLQDRGNAGAKDSNERILQFAAGREAFLQNVLVPLFTEFRGHPSLFAWEVANEPEWAIREFNRTPVAKMPLADFRAFAGEVVDAIHEFGHASATLGSARLLWIRAWSELQLDFYQAHFYPNTELETGQTLSRQLASLPALDKPLWLGELPAHDANSPSYLLESALTECRQAGLSGAAVWRWTTPTPTDSDVAIGKADPEVLRAWLAGAPETGINA